MKGSIWKNTEDEILKACVMKYGPNQWSRISSLIVRKSAKECKARWYEWLDPRIKKTEWTREEEEKLLYLAKIFPSQWRTIAPRIGRTAAQCIDHYERLLDQAQGKDELDENDPRKLRPGEIDPNPETKPPRPDPIHMDEDEKEMLQTARARLANTRGKKAKRKLREKQLEQAKRTSALQKKRELKAAGIEFMIKRKIRGVDYNAEVPFERKIPQGRHDIEDEVPPEPTMAEIGSYMEKRRDEEERKRRELDKAKMKKMKEKNLPKAMEIISKMNDAPTVAFKTKLALPHAQISDKDIDTIGKMNLEKAQALSNSSNEATKALLGEVSQREQTPMTMRTPMVQNSLMSEARKTYDLMNAPTPLVGGQGPQAHEGLLTKTPKGTIPQTPNTYVAQSMRRPDSILRPKDTVRHMPPPVDTPMRAGASEQFGRNKELADSAWESNSIALSVNDKQQKYIDLIESKRDKINLLQSFREMPKPKNEYQMDIDDIEEMDEAELAQIEEKKIEDRELTKKRLQEEASRREIEQFKRQSQVVQQGLPRPSLINFGKLVDEDKLSESEKLIRQEMEKMLIHDNSKFPQEHTKPVNRALGAYPEFSLKELQRANDLINEEMTRQEDYDDKEAILQKYEDYIDEYCNLAYFPKEKYFYELSERSEAEQQEAIETEQKFVKKQLEREKKKISKLQEGLQIAFEARMKEEQVNRQRVDDLVKELEKKSKQLEVFLVVQNLEKKILQARVEEQTKFLKQQESKEKELQQEYYRLTHK
jgi:pre-mRNA-splicing factor CDC5/CEF1